MSLKNMVIHLVLLTYSLNDTTLFKTNYLSFISKKHVSNVYNNSKLDTEFFSCQIFLANVCEYCDDALIS